MSSTAQHGPGRKLLKYTGIFLGCLLSVILVISILLMTVLEPYAGRFLKKQVSEKTGGLYQLTFEDLHIDLFTSTLRLRQVRLELDSAVYTRQLQQGTVPSMLAEVQAPEFQLAGISLMDALLRKQLNIRTISLKKPKVILSSHKRAGDSTTTREDKPKTGFFNSVKVGEIALEGAQITYLPQADTATPQHTIPQLSLRLQDLEIDLPKKSGSSLSWSVDDLELELEKYVVQSPDGVYTLRLGHLTYATKSGELNLESASLKPDPQANHALAPQDASRYLFDIRLPQLQIKGLHLLEAYKSKQLDLEQILLNEAVVVVLENPDIPNGEATADSEKLYAQFSHYLQAVGIEELRLEALQLAYRTSLDSISNIHEIRNTTLTLGKIRLDSSTFFHPKAHSPVQHVAFEAEDYAFHPLLSPYNISIAKVAFSTNNNLLQLDSLLVQGDTKKNDQLKLQGKAIPVVYTLAIPKIRLSSLHPIQAFQQSSLQLGTLTIEQPDVDMVLYQQVSAPPLDSVLTNAYKFFSDVIREIRLGEIRVTGAAFTQHIKNRSITKLQQLEQAGLQISGVLLDSAFFYNQAPLLPIEALSIQAKRYTFRKADSTQIMRLDQLEYSSRTEELNARGITVAANEQANETQKRGNEANRSLFDLSAPLFRVTGLNLVESLNSGTLQLEEILIQKPVLSVLQDRDVPKAKDTNNTQDPLAGLFTWVNPVSINRIRLEDGTFTLREKREEIIRTQLLEHASATFLGLYLHPRTLDQLNQRIPLQEMMLTARDYTYQSPDSLYTITLDSLSYSSRNQGLTARVFQLTADKEAHELLKQTDLLNASRNLFDVTARTFSINGLDLLQAYETGRFDMEEMVLSKPELTILQDQNVALANKQAADSKAEKNLPGEATTTPADTSKIMARVSELVESFRIGLLRIEEGQVQVNVLKDTVQQSQTLERVSLALANLRLTSLDATDPMKMFTIDDLGILVKNYTLITPDSLYEFSIKQISSSLGENLLQIDSLRLKPLFKEDEFVGKLEYASDRFDITVPTVRMLGVNFDALYNQQQILVRKVLIDGPEVNIFRDKRIDADPNRRPGTLQDALLQLPLTITIDSIALQKGMLTYSEIAPTGIEPGVVTLADTKILLRHVSNDSLLIRKNPLVLADAETMFMEAGKLKVQFTFHLDHPEDLHTYEGSLEPMAFAAFNPAFEKLMFVRMESGKITSADFSVTATEHSAEGLMRFRYQDLEIQLLDKNDPKNPGFWRIAGSWVINGLVIKDNNPGKLFHNFRKGEIETERDYQKSVFNQMTQAMLSGIASSLMPGLVEKILEVTIGLP